MLCCGIRCRTTTSIGSPFERFASLADIDQSDPTVEEREEYERPVEMGIVVYAGVDYGETLARAEQEAEVIIWDGGQ